MIKEDEVTKEVDIISDALDHFVTFCNDNNLRIHIEEKSWSSNDIKRNKYFDISVLYNINFCRTIKEK